MLGQVGEKKSFFHRMLHPNADEKEKKSLAAAVAAAAAAEESAKKSSSRGSGLKVEMPADAASSVNGTPSPRSRDVTMSPPRTPASPATSDDHRSDGARDSSAVPSRAGSIRRDSSAHRHTADPHAQPPTDAAAAKRSRTPSGDRKPLKPERSSSTGQPGVAAVAVAPATPPTKPPSVAGDKEPAAPGKFNLKDLLSAGPKLARKSSQAGSTKGSEKGSTKGSEKGYGGDSGSTASLFKKYGVCEKAAIGRGATAVVRLAHKWDRSEEKLYAVKVRLRGWPGGCAPRRANAAGSFAFQEFRKRRKNETEKEYVKKLTSEFCISSTLHHLNVVETVDLVQDEAHHWCEVMEYCPGGDLYAAIKKGGMSVGEVECTFKQIIQGVAYLHSMGVAHRDIKPENLLLDGRGHVKVSRGGLVGDARRGADFGYGGPRGVRSPTLACRTSSACVGRRRRISARVCAAVSRTSRRNSLSVKVSSPGKAGVSLSRRQLVADS
jgi:protein-serine/threonine kinase